MPDPEAPVESRNAPDAIAARIALADLNELLRKTLQLSGVRLAAGLPRRLSPEIAARWFAGPHVLLALSSRAHFDALAGFAALPVEQALALVDRALGGPGKGYVAGPAGAPSEAECGVLAYLAARCVRICAPSLRVRDVRVGSTDDLAPWLERAVLWPVQAALANALELDLKLVFVGQKHLPPGSQRVRLCVREASDGASLEELCSGDLLVFETSAIYADQPWTKRRARARGGGVSRADRARGHRKPRLGVRRRGRPRWANATPRW